MSGKRRGGEGLWGAHPTIEIYSLSEARFHDASDFWGTGEKCWQSIATTTVWATADWARTKKK